MPRSAATILGLVLVASSIGFNSVRYPVVWEMIGPLSANQSTQPAAASQAEKPDSPATQPPAPPPGQPAKPIEMKPAPEAADQRAVQNGVAGRAAPAGGNDAAAAEPGVRKPLIPVTPVSMTGGPTDAAAIRRLPPVEQSRTNPLNPRAEDCRLVRSPCIRPRGSSENVVRTSSVCGQAYSPATHCPFGCPHTECADTLLDYIATRRRQPVAGPPRGRSPGRSGRSNKRGGAFRVARRRPAGEPLVSPCRNTRSPAWNHAWPGKTSMSIESNSSRLIHRPSTPVRPLRIMIRRLVSV